MLARARAQLMTTSTASSPSPTHKEAAALSKTLSNASTEAPKELAASNAQRSPNEVSTVAPSIKSGTASQASSECGSRQSHKQPLINEIPWDELAFGSHIQPLRRYACTIDDIYLLNAFLELSQVPDLDGASVKLTLQALKFLRHCSYSSVDICSILAHASAYFVDVFELCGNLMSPAEVGNVLVTSMYIAHSYIQDETCPLHVWHRHLFKGYCSLKKISEAVMRVMAIRCYILRLTDGDLHTRNEALFAAIRSPLVERVC